jgi:uncharacterized membrane protein YfcA
MSTLPVDAITIYVVAVIAAATLVRATLGFGEALIAVPLLALRTPVAVAAPLAVSVSIVVAGAIVLQDWRRIEVRSAGGLVVSALFGIPLGVLLLAAAGDHVVKLILGFVIVGFSLYSLAAGAKIHLQQDHWGLLLGCGFLSGVLGGAYGMNGPPLAIYGALRRWSPQRFRATLQGYFLLASIAGLIGYVSIGLWSAAVTRYFLLSLPGVVGAIVLGRAINRRMNGDRFLRVVYGGLVLTGVALLVQALSA